MIYPNNSYGLIDRFCAKHPRFGIPNLMLYLVVGQAAVFLLDLFFSGLLSLYWLPLYRTPLFQGQLWRLVTFLFIPSNRTNPFFLLLSCYFYYWIGSMLEREWGTAKFSLFYLSGVVLSILSGLLLGYSSIYYVNLSIFLVIATLYGEMQVLLFFVVPIKMKWLALIDVGLILVDVINFARDGIWVYALLPLASFVNYFIFTWPFWSTKLGLARRRHSPKVVQFKKAQKQQERAGQHYRHKCAVCGLTDLDDPDMEFRYCSRCDGYHCYCAEHINRHVHIHQEE
ncbi:MAG TPA: rhomboid family intramembrane serine protease [Firmicutes bacterium]|nr:rhomboid family intramembrane serine protease [Bacillota bacterium]